MKEAARVLTNKNGKRGYENLAGRRYGRLTVIRYVGKKPNRHGLFWEVKCDCGNLKEVVGYNLRNGNTNSCGCYFTECVKGRLPNNKLPKGEANINSLYGRYKRSAKNRSIDFVLDKKSFVELINDDCYYCGNKPSTKYSGHSTYNGSIVYNGIDRVDNSIGYIIDNCVTCCSDCNYLKNNVSKNIILKAAEFLTNQSNKTLQDKV